MVSYVVTGSSQGLGFAFLEQLSKNPSNKVFGLARNKNVLEAKLEKAGISSITVLESDVGSLASLQSAAGLVSEFTGGSLDVLINNAGLVSKVTEFKALSSFDSNPEVLEKDMLDSFKVNTLGLLHSIQAFLPLIRRGIVKKIANISTGVADLDIINGLEIEIGGAYSASKAAANVVIASYNAAHKRDGILFLSISPGYVETERNLEAAESDMKKAMEMGKKFAVYAPHFTKMLTTEESVTAVLSVIEQKSVQGGDGGKFISHLGNQQWL